MASLGRCMICDKRIACAHVICAGCERDYGLGGPRRDWPAWAKALYREYRQQRRLEKDRLAHEDATERGDAVYNISCYGNFNDDGC